MHGSYSGKPEGTHVHKPGAEMPHKHLMSYVDATNQHSTMSSTAHASAVTSWAAEERTEAQVQHACMNLLNLSMYSRDAHRI